MWLRPRSWFFTFLFLACCSVACLPAYASSGENLTELTDQQLLQRLSDNLLTLGSLQEQQLKQLAEAQLQLKTAQDSADNARTQSAEALRQSNEARALALQSESSSTKALTSFESFRDDLLKEQKKLKIINNVLIGTTVGVAVIAIIALAIAPTC